MKSRTLLRAATAMVLLSATVAAQAQLRGITGNVTAVYADPSDLVIQLDVRGHCGSALFHVRRTAGNFREMTEIAMTAMQANKRMLLFVGPGCTELRPSPTSRHTVSHGAVLR